MFITPAFAQAAGAAAEVQRKLGCPVGVAFDVQAVCSGFVYALSAADGFVARGRSKCALVIGAETMTRLMDWTDRGTCVLFGDGAGAVVLEPGEGEGTTADRGLLGFALPLGFVDTKVCAIDETWSGLKLVIRKELR